MNNELNLEAFFEWIILTLSIIFVFIGIGGLILVITNKYHSDVLLQYAYTFVYLYMFILGTFLFIYRKKIVVKK